MTISNSDGAGTISFVHSLMQLRPQALPFRCATIFSYLCVVVALFGTAMALRADLVGGDALIVISTVFFFFFCIDNVLFDVVFDDNELSNAIKFFCKELDSHITNVIA